MKKLIIFTDVGDTIIDEGSEIREIPYGVVQHAKCIPGAKETMLRLYEKGYTIALVADGLIESFDNTMQENGLSHIFSAKAISEEIGVEKPDPRIFRLAMDRLGLTDSDKGRIIMAGNNILRDVAGANRFGIHSVLLDWSPRYSYEAANTDQIPDYRIHTPEALFDLAEALNSELQNTESK